MNAKQFGAAKELRKAVTDVSSLFVLALIRNLLYKWEHIPQAPQLKICLFYEGQGDFLGFHNTRVEVFYNPKLIKDTFKQDKEEKRQIDQRGEGKRVKSDTQWNNPISGLDGRLRQ